MSRSVLKSARLAFLIRIFLCLSPRRFSPRVPALYPVRFELACRSKRRVSNSRCSSDSNARLGQTKRKAGARSKVLICTLDETGTRRKTDAFHAAALSSQQIFRPAKFH